MPHFAVSDLVLHCLPVSHKKDARLFGLTKIICCQVKRAERIHFEKASTAWNGWQQYSSMLMANKVNKTMRYGIQQLLHIQIQQCTNV